MRGKVHSVTLYRDHVGITPAYAGKSKCRDDVRTLRKDHPRLCGEKRQSHFPPEFSSRITPAYAGKRAKKSVMRSAGQDHPRLCGEKDRIAKLSYAMKGSPPPMRGKVYY